MTDFKRTLVADEGVAQMYSERLGTAGTGDFSSTTDIGALVKYGTNPLAMVLCADGDDIEGQVQSVDVGLDEGYSFGLVKMSHRIMVLKGDLTLGDFAVAGVQALGAASTVGVAKAGAGVNYKWRCIAIDGSYALLQKV